MDADNNFIPLIYSYCDHWCERCAFTDRCRVFARNAEYGLESSDDPVGDTIRIVGESFAEAKLLLTEKAEEMGIDLKAAVSDPEIDASMERARLATESEPAAQLAQKYTLETRALIERSAEWIANDTGADPMTEDMLEVLNYYLFPIAVKVRSCYHAALDIDGYPNPEEISDSQSYANGTAKITLIELERTISAWQNLLHDSNSHLLEPVIERLEKIKEMLEEKFPNARDFVRPGFDEIEIVM